jgi:hypothetical protein
MASSTRKRVSVALISPNVRHADCLASLVCNGTPFAPRLALTDTVSLFCAHAYVVYDGQVQEVAFEILVVPLGQSVPWKVDSYVTVASAVEISKGTLGYLFEYVKAVLCYAYRYAFKVPGSTFMTCKPAQCREEIVGVNAHLLRV